MTHRRTHIGRGPQPDNDLDQAGATLQSHSNMLYQNAHHHLRLELSAADGFPEKGDQLNVRATAELTTVEAHAEARLALTAAQDALRATKADLLAALATMNAQANLALRMRRPRNPVQPDLPKGLCRENQAGLHAVIEWGDANCFDYATKKGLCQKHYDAWRYARIRDGVDITRDYEQAQP